MKWPWTRRVESQGTDAHKAAIENLASAHARDPEVKRVSQSLRELRERNHFASQIELIFEGGRK